MPHAVIFPFDLFGSAGSGAGAKLLGDVLQEVIDDTRQEKTKVRQHVFARKLKITEVPFDELQELQKWRETGRSLFQSLLAKDPFILWLAGNHLGVLPVYESFGQETTVIQFDAHLDCYDLHDTHATLSHGNFLKQVKGPRIVNVGHRDLFLTSERIAETFAAAYSIDHFTHSAVDLIGSLLTLTDQAQRVWFDIDVDVFDPSVCPAVHEPLPCGLTGRDLLSILNALRSEKVAGVSISEFDPGRDEKDRSLNLLGWLIEWLLLKDCE